MISDQELELWLTIMGAPRPDISFSGELLDKVIRYELCLDVPLYPLLCPTDTSPRYYKLPGCYAWCDVETLSVAYVGKAVNLKARLYHHWHHPGFMNKWANDNPFGWFPWAVCWFTAENEKAALEAHLLDVLCPPYNRKRE